MPDTYPYLARQLPGRENTREDNIRAASWVMRQSDDESAVHEVMQMLFQPSRGTRMCSVCHGMRVRAGTVPQTCQQCLSTGRTRSE